VVVEAGVEDEKERNIIRALTIVPRGHYMSRLLNFVRIFQVFHHEFQIQRIVPGFALLPTAYRIATSSFEESLRD
jgi:hypothetical protein